MSPFSGQLAVATLAVLKIMPARNGQKENREACASSRSLAEERNGKNEQLPSIYLAFPRAQNGRTPATMTFARVCDRRPFLPYLKQDPADVLVFQDMNGL